MAANTVRTAAALELQLQSLGRRKIRLMINGNAGLLEGFSRVLQKSKFSLNGYSLDLVGDGGRLRLEPTIPQVSRFFEAIGDLASLTVLGFQDLEFPLELLVRLLQRRPGALSCLSLYNTELLLPDSSAGNSVQQQFSLAIQALPELLRVTMEKNLSKNPEPTASTLLRVPKPRFQVFVDLPGSAAGYRDAMQSLGRQDAIARGAEVHVQRISLATQALGNPKLSVLGLHLQLGRPDPDPRDLPMATFCQALLQGNKSLDTLELSLPKTELLDDFLLVLPNLELRELVVKCLHPEDTPLWMADVAEALEHNYWLEVLETHHTPGSGGTHGLWNHTEGSWSRVRSSRIDLYLRLNRPRSGQQHSRRHLLANPSGPTKKEWVETFIAFSQDGDLDALHYYLHKYCSYMSKEVSHDANRNRTVNTKRTEENQRVPRSLTGAGKGVKRKHEASL